MALFIALGFLLIPLMVIFWPYAQMTDQYTEIKWVVFYAIASLLTVSFFRKPSEIKFPSLQKKIWLVVALVASYAFSALINLPGNYERVFLEWLCFTAFLIGAYSAEPETLFAKIEKANLISTSIVLAYGLLQTFGIEPISGLFVETSPTSLFGNANLLAEFLAISIIIQLAGLTKKPQNIFRILLVAISGIALLLLYARSALLGFAAALIFLLVCKDISIKIKKTIIAGGMLGALGILALWLPFSPFYKGAELTKKSTSFELRVIRAKNTLQMIQDHPLGVGPNRYQFSYLSYHRMHAYDPESNEVSIADSPHNGYLEVASQNGVQTLFILLIALVVIFGRIRTWPMAGIVFILTDAIFAFPMRVTFPFFAFAVFAGMALRLHYPEQTWTIKRSTRLFLGVASLITIWFSLIFTFVFYVEAQEPHHLELNSAACNLGPSRWQLCYRKALLESRAKLFERAENTCLDALEKYPNHYLFMEIYSSVLFAQGLGSEACSLLRRYDELFSKASTLHANFIATCKE